MTIRKKKLLILLSFFPVLTHANPFFYVEQCVTYIQENARRTIRRCVKFPLKGFLIKMLAKDKGEGPIIDQKCIVNYIKDVLECAAETNSKPRHNQTSFTYDLEMCRQLQKTITPGICSGLTHTWIANRNNLLELTRYILTAYDPYSDAKNPLVSRILQRIVYLQLSAPGEHDEGAYSLASFLTHLQIMLMMRPLLLHKC